MTVPMSPIPRAAEAMKALHLKWGWIVAFGVVAVIAGMVALGSVVMATASAVFIVGIAMLMVGIAEIIAAFNVRTWGRFLLWLLLGALYVVAGYACLNNPFVAATFLTLLLGWSLIVSGVLRIFIAFQMKHGTPWGWVVLSGLVSLLLGGIIVARWPVSSFYTLGLFLGFDLLVIGWGWIAMGLALKRAARASS